MSFGQWVGIIIVVIIITECIEACYKHRCKNKSKKEEPDE